VYRGCRQTGERLAAEGVGPVFEGTTFVAGLDDDRSESRVEIRCRENLNGGGVHKQGSVEKRKKGKEVRRERRRKEGRGCREEREGARQQHAADRR
jgi:hypothetical protein